MKRTAAFVMTAMLALALVGCGGKECAAPKTVATVDGKPISGADYYDYLSMSFGRQVLPMMIEQQILLNWAEKEGAPVTDEQIAKQMEMLKRDGNYEDQVSNAGSEDALKSRYREVQARTNIGEKIYKFSDDDLMTIYNNPRIKSRYVHGPRKHVAVLLSTSADQIKKAEKAIKGGMDFDEAVAKYADSMFTMSGTPKTFVEDGKGPEGLWKAAKATKEGEVSKVFALDLPPYGTLQAILKVIGAQPKVDMKFDKVKDEVKGIAALQKTMTDTSFQTKLDARKKKADIKIELEQYKNIVEQIKNPPQQMGYPQQMAPNVKPGPATKPGR